MLIFFAFCSVIWILKADATGCRPEQAFQASPVQTGHCEMT